MKATTRLTGEIARTFTTEVGRLLEFGGQPFQEFVLPRVKHPAVVLPFRGRFAPVPQAPVPFLQEA